MISTTKANAILKVLTGQETLTKPSSVWLGLSASQPAADGSGLAEPATGNYERVEVGGSCAVNAFSVPAEGIVSNTKEIKFNTARQAYGNKMMYWFLSESKTGSAILWGIVKDVLKEKSTLSGFTVDGEGYSYTETLDSESLLKLKEGEKYIIYWDGKEYEYVAQTQDSYLVLGDEKDGLGLMYTETSTGTQTTGTLKFITSDAAGQHTVAIYGLGIDVKKETVPTFYAGELKASIDVEL